MVLLGSPEDVRPAIRPATWVQLGQLLVGLPAATSVHINLIRGPDGNVVPNVTTTDNTAAVGLMVFRTVADITQRYRERRAVISALGLQLGVGYNEALSRVADNVVSFGLLFEEAVAMAASGAARMEVYRL